MKIGIFTDAYNPTTSGVVTSINMVEQEMKKRGHEVYVFAPTKAIQPNDNQTLYMVRSIPLLIAKEYKYRIATFYSREVAKRVKELGIDVVHTQDEFSLGLFGKIMSRKMNIPFIHTYHTMWEDYLHYISPFKGNHSNLKKVVRNFSKTFVRKASCVIAPSKKTAEYLKNECKVQNKPIYVVPTGIDIVPFKAENFTDEDRLNLKTSLGIAKDEKVILFLGRIADEKSIDVIIDQMPELFKKYNKVKFVIAGYGPQEEDLKAQVKKLNIQDKVIFTGKIPWVEVPKYYNMADVFVNASLTETQGLTFIEAMAASTPVVCKYAPNLTEFITNEKNGIFVHNNSEFSDAIIRVLDDKDLRDTLISNGLETANDFSSEKFGEKLETIYSEMIKLNKEKNKEKKKTIYSTIKKKLQMIAKK